MIRSLLTSGLLIATLMVILAPTTYPAGEESAKPWRIVKALRFFVDQEPDFSSEVYRQGSFFLVYPATGDEAYLLSKRDRLVYSAALDAVRSPDGEPGLDPSELSIWTELSGYEKADRGRWLVWQQEERSLAVGPKPELIGETTLAQVLEEKPVYREQADAYTPDAAVISGIEPLAGGLGFVIGFGTWCPVCADWTPRLIRTLEAAGVPHEQITFVSTDAEITRPEEPLARYSIKGVPTFIVLRDGEELGRVQQVDLDRDPDDPIESRILRILQGKES